MKAASINEIKKELSNHNSSQLLDYCLRLARFKKENKELLSFLLFEEHNREKYINEIKIEITGQFEEMNRSNIYLVKKSVSKILRNLNKQIRFAMSPEVEAQLLIHFCNCINEYSILENKSRQLRNLYENQFPKIKKSLEKLHPDIQYDLKRQLNT